MLYDPVDRFLLAIRLWVADNRETFFDSEVVTQLPHLFIIKLFPVVGYQLVWDSESAHYSSVHKLGQLLCCDLLLRSVLR